MIALLLGLASAFAGELRTLTLTDGRLVRGEVVEMTASDLVIRTAQGQMRLPVNRLADLNPLDPAEWAAQPPLRALVLPFVSAEPTLIDEAGLLAGRVATTFDAIPATSLVTDLAPAQADYLDACGLNTDCALPIGKAHQGDVVIAGSLDPEGSGYQLLINLTWVNNPRARRQVSVVLPALGPAADDAIQSCLYAALQLEPPPRAVATVEIAAPRRGASPVSQRVETLAWMPLPGVPSLARHDYVGLAWSVGVALPVSAVGVHLAGRSAMHPDQLAGLSLLSWYVTAVAVNHAIGLRGPGRPPIGE